MELVGRCVPWTSDDRKKAEDAWQAKVNALLGDDAFKVLRRLREYLTDLTVDVAAEGSLPTRPIFSLLGFLVEQNQRQNRYPVPPTTGRAFTDKKIFLQASRYTNYALAAYSSRSGILEITGLPEEDLVHVHESPDVLEPNFFIALDREAKAIVLSVRGTNNIGDIITDVLAYGVPFLKGHAHKGMLLSAKRIIELAMPLMEDVPGLAEVSSGKCTGKVFDKIILTGHSYAPHGGTKTTPQPRTLQLTRMCRVPVAVWEQAPPSSSSCFSSSSRASAASCDALPTHLPLSSRRMRHCPGPC